MIEPSASLSVSEISPGLVLFLLPSLLEEHGATCNLDWPDSIVGEHYFVCVYSDGDSGFWIPVTSKDRRERLPLLSNEKAGHKNWRQKPSFCRSDQIWEIPTPALCPDPFPDRSTPAQRNLVLNKGMARIWAAIL